MKPLITGTQNINDEIKKANEKAHFKRVWEEYKSEHFKPKLFNREQAYKLLGFRKSKELTDWLRDNDFIDYDNYVNSYFLEMDLMEEKFKYVTGSYSGYNDEFHCYSRYDESGASLTKTFCVPLFTQAGIAFFKNLLANPEELKKVSDTIRSEHHYHSKTLI